jgi:hypothetical protein
VRKAKGPPLQVSKFIAEAGSLAGDNHRRHGERNLSASRRPAKAKSGLSSASANHIGVLRGFVSAYSQNGHRRNQAAVSRSEPSLVQITPHS